jgi:hypothetical protein
MLNIGNVKKSFGENLSYLMKERRVSAKKLSQDLSLPYKSVQDWLAHSGTKRIPRDPYALKKLSEYFNCSIEFLLFGEEPLKTVGIESLLQSVSVHSGLYRINIERVIEKKNTSV